MTKDEQISVERLAEKVDEMSANMITKDLLKSEVGRIDMALNNHVEYTRSAAQAETLRINAILKDNADKLLQANNEANEKNIASITLADKVANTLRELVETTRAASAKAQAEVINPIIARLDEIQQRQYENKGMDTVRDPIMTKLIERMESIATTMSEGKGKDTGMNAMWGYIIGAIGLIATIGSIIVMASRLP